MLIFKVKIKQKLNSKPEITRKNEIFPAPENSSHSERLKGVSRMRFFGGKGVIHILFVICSQTSNGEIARVYGFHYVTFNIKIEKNQKLNKLNQ